MHPVKKMKSSPANFVVFDQIRSSGVLYIFLVGFLVDVVISEVTTVHLFDSRCSITLMTCLFRLVKESSPVVCKL